MADFKELAWKVMWNNLMIFILIFYWNDYDLDWINILLELISPVCFFFHFKNVATRKFKIT